jgi:hypothetical protein
MAVVAERMLLNDDDERVNAFLHEYPITEPDCGRCVVIIGLYPATEHACTDTSFDPVATFHEAQHSH